MTGASPSMSANSSPPGSSPPGSSPPGPYRIGLAGLGAIGLPVARWLDSGAGSGIDGLVLAAVSANDPARAAARLADFRTPPPVLPLAALAAAADVIVEMLPPDRFLDIALPAIDAGRLFLPLTVTAFVERPDLIARARATGARIIVPTGALLGLDAVRAVAEGAVTSIVMVTRKPPRSLQSARIVRDQGLDLGSLTEPTCLYRGSVRDAAAKFPANVNVSVALALAGIGLDRTQYEVWADPALDRNTHSILVEAAAARFEMSIAGVPSPETPGTGRLTPHSVMATLRRLVAPMTIGT